MKINDKIFKGGFGRLFKLQPSIEQQKDKERERKLKELNAVPSCLVAYFIAEIQTALTKEKYICESVTGYINTNLAGSVPVMEIAVVPADAASQLHILLAQHDLLHRDKAYQGMSNIKYTIIDTLKDYSLYDHKTGFVNERLLKFNYDFDWVVRMLRDLCLENPTMAMNEATNIVISNIQAMMSKGDKSSQL